ncbi:UNVERIFIED_CONTAM: hypothetical protein GTU68_045104, partial [Idotea baltica]|nr:hypothetical protein [Idotea baltica]
MAKILNPKYLLPCQQNSLKSLKFISNQNLLPKRNIGSIPTTSQVVICGSGIVGNSIAYHLTQEGWKDVLVIDQNKIGSGTSSYGSGVVGLFRDSSERWVVTHSLELLTKLQKEGHNLGLRKCGSINLAQTSDRAIFLKRRLAYIKPSGLGCEWVEPSEIHRLHPYLNTSDLKGAIWLEEDSVADVQAVCSTL